MSAADTPNTHSLIDRYYDEERELREKELSLAELTLRLDANDLALLGMISRRFRKGREEVAQEVLSSALVDLFSRIEPGERKLMARDADDAAKGIADSIAEDNGIMNAEFRSGYWAQQERNIVKAEKAREKALKAAEKEQEKQQMSQPAQTEEKMVEETSTPDLEEESVHYPEASAIEKAPAALETQVEAANEQEAAEEERASASE